MFLQCSGLESYTGKKNICAVFGVSCSGVMVIIPSSCLMGGNCLTLVVFYPVPINTLEKITTHNKVKHSTKHKNTDTDLCNRTYKDRTDKLFEGHET